LRYVWHGEEGSFRRFMCKRHTKKRI
jgi:hypothetical protein